MMLLGTQDKDFFPKTIEAKLQYVRDLGFDCFEIDGKLLTDNVKEVKKAIADTGVPVTSACNGYRGWIGDFIEERRLNGVADLQKILETLAEVGGKGVVIPAAWGMFSYRLPPMNPPRSHEGDVEAILKSLEVLNKTAGETGTWVFLEALNRYEDHMLNRQEDSVQIIKLGGFDRVKLTCDFYHMSIEEDDISETLFAYKDYVGHIHIAENHRYQPGTGSIDWGKHMRTLKEIEYDGPIINEGRIRGEDQAAAYKKSISVMRRFM